MQTLAELVALFGGQKPASPSAATATDNLASLLGPENDLVSWLHPENAVLSGPRRSEFDDMESWIEACVNSWEKQHGPIPKKRAAAP